MPFNTMNKIFLIDEDDQVIFKKALKLINPLPQCHTATNGKIAFDKLKATTSLPDIIFLDLNMPIMNGWEFLIQVRKEVGLNRIPVGIFTTSNIVRDEELAKELGGRFFLTKPNDFQTLLKKLQQILSAEFSINEYVSFI